MRRGVTDVQARIPAQRCTGRTRAPARRRRSNDPPQSKSRRQAELESFTLDRECGAELCAAASEGKESAVRDLLRTGDVNLLLWRDPEMGRSALHHAAEGHCGVMQVLLKGAATAVLNLQDDDGSTALALAAQRCAALRGVGTYARLQQMAVELRALHAHLRTMPRAENKCASSP